MQITVIVKNHPSTHRPHEVINFSNTPRVGEVLSLKIEDMSPILWEVLNVHWQQDENNIMSPKYIYVDPYEEIFPTI